MAATANGIPLTPATEAAPLERRYIELLEKKVAALEKQLTTAQGGSTASCPNVGLDQDAGKATDSAEAASKSTTEDKAQTGGSRVRSVISKWNPKECARIDTDASTVAKNEKKESHAFIFRKVQDDKDKFVYSEVEIIFSGLKTLLHKNLRHYPGHYWDGDTVTILDPFCPIVHNWDALQAVANENGDKLFEEDKQARSDLKLLLDIISTSSGVDKLGMYFKEREQHTKNRTITYEALWTLFSPGCLVYAEPFLKQSQIFIVGSSMVDFPAEGRRVMPWSISCWGYDWNGETFDRRAYEFEFEKFVGPKPINSLPCYPLEFYTHGNGNETERLQSSLLARGWKVLYRGIGISTIDNATQVTRVNDDDDRSYITSSTEELTKSTRRKLTKLMTCDVKEGTTVMIDFLSYFQYADKIGRLGDLKSSGEDNECGCPSCRSNKVLSNLLKFDYDGATGDEEFEPLQLMMCPPRVLGYVIERKMWAQLRVEDVKPVENVNGPDTFDEKLKLEPNTKDMLRDLVTNHEAGKQSKDGKRTKGIQDVIQGKGDGLVILLHDMILFNLGILHAEHIAMRARKPLFAVGVTDVGVVPEKVQVNLERMFDLAGTWEAVLLIDEADVFLDSRAGKGGQTDIRRNALVSVLLRVLEYYQGILILTTNRIRDFDIAVQSRIHLAIKYDDLSRDQKIDIFNSFLEQVKEKGHIENWDKVCKWVTKEANYNLNGRQIRNIVTSAMGLARAGERKLRVEDLADVARMTKEFKQDTSVQEAVYRASQIDGR
ncbi:hypothetical protein MMC30_001698 [Trapelia coarctata]|nr:hypothetical protein [Trapelia coarctata]